MEPKNIDHWPFPVFGKLTLQSKVLVGGKPDTKKVVTSIQALQAEKLKKFDSSMTALFENFGVKAKKTK